VNQPVLQIDLLLAHGQKLFVRAKPHLDHDHDDVLQMTRREEFNEGLFFGGEVVRLAGGAGQPGRKLDRLARIHRQPFLLHRYVQDSIEHAILPVNCGWFQDVFFVGSQFGFNPSPGSKTVG